MRPPPPVPRSPAETMAQAADALKRAAHRLTLTSAELNNIAEDLLNAAAFHRAPLLMQAPWPTPPTTAGSSAARGSSTRGSGSGGGHRSGKKLKGPKSPKPSAAPASVDGAEGRSDTAVTAPPDDQGEWEQAPCGVQDWHGCAARHVRMLDKRYMMFHAAARGCETCVMALLESKVSPSCISDTQHYTALMFAEWGARPEGGNHDTTAVVDILKSAEAEETEMEEP